MVLVDVYVPAVDQNYNFSLNEDVRISAIIKEIVEMIVQKEQTRLQGEQEGLNLYSLKEKRILPRENTLSDCYITGGSLLMLV